MPFPISLLMVPFLGFCYRCRGGFLGLGPNMTVCARLLWWALPVGIAAFLTAFRLWPALGCFVLGYVCMIFPPSLNSGYQNRGWANYLGMAYAGTVRMAIMVLPLALLWHWQSVFVIPLGALSGLAYAIGWELLDGVASPISTKGFWIFAAGNFATGGSEWGEALTGAAFGLAFAMLPVVT